MSDLISRKAALAVINAHRCDTAEIEAGILDLRPVEAVPVVQVHDVLKETYLEIANEYSVSDLYSDNDKVACVASKYRQMVLDKLKRRDERRCDMNIEKLFAQIDCYIKSNEERNNTFVSVLEAAKDKLTEYQKAMQNFVERLEEEGKHADKEKERCATENHFAFDSAKGYANGIYNAIEIVKEEGGINDNT